MTPKGHAIPSKTQLLSYGTPAFQRCFFAARSSPQNFTMMSSRISALASPLSEAWFIWL